MKRIKNRGIIMSATTELERINALRRYHILDTPPDGAFDRITSLAARILNVPISIVSLVDTDRIWFKSHHGLDVEEIDRVPGLCASAILNHIPYILNDALIDPRSLANPLVAGELGFRFYVGIPLTTQDNYNLGVLSIIDFEPRIITEEELKTLNDLAQLVMDQMELRLASRNINELNKEKSNLLAVLSHEIRTPMNGIMGIASLLHSTELNGEQKEYMEIIETSGESLLNMVDHILDYSKIEAGKMELHIQNFDIRSCVSQVLQLFAANILKKGILLKSEIAEEIPAVLKGDKYKIRQILINLVGNAVKFTNKGEILVSVMLNPYEKNGEFVNLALSVKDSGIGIQSDQVDRLFHSFTQVNAIASQVQYGGTGLGLSICKQLVELMNGRIWLEESTVSGSTFTFELKLYAL
jgi:signal transduction histidine kinase